MPNYAITSVYQPFSFQERIAPLQMLKEEYDKVGEALTNFSDDSNAYYNYLDPTTRAQVDKYNATLQSVADSLSREGLKAVSRNTLFDLKRMYNNQIKPINEAAKGYAELQDQVRKMQMQDPTLIVNNMPTVGDLMGNPGAMPSMVSGSTLYQQGTLAASQLPDISYEQIQRYLAGDTSAIPNIDTLTMQIGSMYGVGNLDDNGRRRALGYIMQGLGDGLSARTAEMSAYQQKLATQHQYDIAKIWANAAASASTARTRTDENIRLAERKAELAAATKGAGSGRASYEPQVSEFYIKNGSTYVNKDHIKDASANSQAVPTSFVNLSTEHQKAVCEMLNIPYSDVDDYRDILDHNYSYLERRGKGSKGDPDELHVIPTNRAHSTNTSSVGQPNGWTSEYDMDDEDYYEE